MNRLFLADTSVIARLDKPAVRAQLQPLIQQALLATCEVLDIEAGYSARNPGELEQTLSDRRHVYTWVPMRDDAWHRIARAQEVLVSRGEHRGIGIVDMLIGATAAAHTIGVLHYEHDFELLAPVMGFRHRWVVQPGSVD